MELSGLSKSELEIMKILWEADGPMRLYEIHEENNRRNNKEWKYSTISSYLQRLTYKGYLTGIPLKGHKGCSYAPAVTEAEYMDMYWGGLRAFGLKKALSCVAAAMYKEPDLTQEDADELNALLAAKGEKDKETEQ